jgi:hypothetical protein
MNVQKSLFLSLLGLGMNTIYPQRYVCSKADHNSELVFGFLKQEGHDMFVLIAHYSFKGRTAIPDPEVILWVSPLDKIATTVTCEWPNKKEVASRALDKWTANWLEAELRHGHHFSINIEKKDNVVPLRLGKGRPHANIL